MSRLLTAVETFLRKDDWKFTTEDDKYIRLGVNGKNGTFNGTFIIYDTRFSFYFTIPIYVPLEKRAAVCEYICRANYGLNLGNLEMDMEDGEVRYKTSSFWEEEYMPCDEFFKDMIYININTLDKYSKGINEVVYGGINPQKAVEDVEG
jgi:hypothetical protein